ncbi:metal-dependent hydrolase [Candidatus Micrarchaeota archaeon]|nr:metal-dependent hydrolase [Candidatus Micrarchaeota archaeon]
MELTFLGHSGFFAKLGSKKFLFDPWFGSDNQRLIPATATPSQFRQVDAIFVSHEHFDHCDGKALADIVGRTLAHVIGPAEALDLIPVAERLKMRVKVGERFTVNGYEVTVVQAQHPKSAYPVGFVVRCGGQKLYHAGDTYDFYGLTGIDADVGLLPIGGTYTMDLFAAITALKRLRLKHVIPMHYGTFKQIEADVGDFAKRVKTSSRTQCHVLQPGQSIEL